MIELGLDSNSMNSHQMAVFAISFHSFPPLEKNKNKKQKIDGRSERKSERIGEEDKVCGLASLATIIEISSPSLTILDRIGVSNIHLISTG